MKNEPCNGITRRSFIKRSTVAAIAASHLMMFTGLVNAVEESPSPFETGLLPPNCSVVKDPRKVDFSIGHGEYERIEKLTECWCSDNGVGNGEIACGVWKTFDAEGNETSRAQAFVTCGSGGNTITQTVMCWDEPWITPVDPR